MGLISVVGLVCNDLLLIDGVLSGLCKGWSEEMILESVVIADYGRGRNLDGSVMNFR